jgi:hypothetical protein
MEQGKKEIEERRIRDRLKAEAAMKAVKGPDYKMPEKSDLLLRYEKAAREKREAEEKEAAEKLNEYRVMHAENDIANISMQFFTENVGKVVDAGMGASFMKYFIDKIITQEAEKARAADRQRDADSPEAAEKLKKEIADRMAAGESIQAITANPLNITPSQ